MTTFSFNTIIKDTIGIKTYAIILNKFLRTEEKLTIIRIQLVGKNI